MDKQGRQGRRLFPSNVVAGQQGLKADVLLPQVSQLILFLCLPYCCRIIIFFIVHMIMGLPQPAP